MSHPVTDIDDTIHQRVRLGILAVLAESRRVDFTHLRGTLDVTDGNLSRHLQVLEDGGYVRIDKSFEGKRPRTWISATKQGRAAFEAELETLRALLERVDGEPA